MKNYEREDVLRFLLKSLTEQININNDNCFLLEVKDKYGTTSQDNIAKWLQSDYVKQEHKWTKWELETMSHIGLFYEALTKGEREGTIVLWGDEDDGWNSDQTVDIDFPSLKYTSTKEEFNIDEELEKNGMCREEQ